jgi:hypothetical protein
MRFKSLNEVTLLANGIEQIVVVNNKKWVVLYNLSLSYNCSNYDNSKSYAGQTST